MSKLILGISDTTYQHKELIEELCDRFDMVYVDIVDDLFETCVDFQGPIIKSDSIFKLHRKIISMFKDVINDNDRVIFSRTPMDSLCQIILQEASKKFHNQDVLDELDRFSKKVNTCSQLFTCNIVMEPFSYRESFNDARYDLTLIGLMENYNLPLIKVNKFHDIKMQVDFIEDELTIRTSG